MYISVIHVSPPLLILTVNHYNRYNSKDLFLILCKQLISNYTRKTIIKEAYLLITLYIFIL